MACTSQSASDYIKRARLHLVRELQNLSVIVENLYQQRVLSDEEVSKIQAEADDYDKTRRILDSTIKKGEEACYKFLRIIDITRKRTLGRPSVLPESKPVPSTETKKFDLHHWISCFSFKDETKMETNYLQGSKQSHRYQDHLKSKALKISRDFWMASKNLFEENKPDLSYTSLVLDTQKNISPSKIKKLKSKKSRMSRPKKLRTYVPEDKPEISPRDLLKTAKNILVVGEPGIGKTALSLEMFKVWAERDNEELDYMFYFDMRQMSENPKNLEDLLFNVFSEPGEGKEEVLQDIKKNSDNVTIIFDGVTDLSSSVVQKLVDKDLLPDAKIIITCRPEDEEDVFTEDFLRVEVKGFSEKTIKTYLSATLGEEQKKVSSNLELLTLCHVPMYALMVAACFSSQQSAQPCTVTEIYINIVRLSLQMNSNRTKTKDLNSFITNKSEEILSLAQVAFLATEGRTVNLTELPCEDICVLSFLKPLVIKVAHTETITRYAFLHYTIQEFFAAVWLLKNPDKIKDIFQQCLTEDKKHMKHLIPFMCRLLNEKSPTLMKCLIPAQELKTTSNWFFKEAINTFFFCLCEEEDTEDSGPDVDILFLCQCLYESQCPETCIYFLEKLDYHLDLSGQTLDPYPCCAVSYVIAQSKEKKIRLNLEDVKVSDKGMSRLFGCLQNVQWCDPLPLQLWKIFLLSEEQMDHMSLIRLDGNQLHLPVVGRRQLFERAVKVMKKITTKVNVCLYWDREAPDYQDLCESLLEALPHINSLRFSMTYRHSGIQDEDKPHREVEKEKHRLLMDLCLQAALEQGEHFHSVGKTLHSLFSVNTSFDCILLDFYEHVKIKGGSDVLQRLRPIFQSFPTVWSINLSERKTSILLEVLKLQPEKKTVKLRGWSDEESEVRSFLQCLPYISQLSCDPDFFQRVCTSMCVRSREEVQQLASLLQLLGFTLTLTGYLPRKTCCSVGRVLRVCGSKVDLILTPRMMSVRGAAHLFRRTTQLHSLRLSNDMAMLLFQWIRRGRVVCLLTIEELCLAPETLQSQRGSLRVVSSLASLLRYWTVRHLDLTEFCVSAQCLCPLLLHDGPLTIKLRDEVFQQLLVLLHEIQDKDLAWSFLSKVGGDLTSYCLNWELLHFVLQSSAQTFTVNLRKNQFLQENVTRLLPFLDRIRFKRPGPSFVLAAIRQVYKTQASHLIPSLVRSLDHVISLTCRELDSVDCAALIFTLRHSDRVTLKLVWTSIPAEEIQRIVFTLDRVSHLSVDRNLLLRFIHCCAATDVQQEAAPGLIRSLQHRLDLSCSSCVELPDQDQTETLSLSAADCRSISTILTHSSQDTQLDLRDCEVEDSGLDLLFPVLNRVHLRASKAVLLQLVSLVPVSSERDSVRRAESLCRALDGELDLSHTTLDQRVCEALDLMLDFSEGLTELDLSHCDLTDQLLLTFIKHLHKVHVLDLSHNKISDASTVRLLQLVSINSSITTVRLFSNNIVDKTPFKKQKQFEM
ncbi:uncharacterized protein [Channa argus]|uniref:uncharacterized protein isoform X2 n=1 Tax=Channa argus TaxID=215402 RepID=UPI003520575E